MTKILWNRGLLMRVNSKNACFQLLVTAIVLVLLQHPVVAADQTPPVRRILKSASELDYPPLAMIRPDGTADGFSVDLLKAVTRSAGLEVAFVVGPWHEIKQELMDGRLDVLPLVSYSAEREKYFDFTAPYLRMHGTIFVRKGEKSIRGREDLKGRELLVMRGDTAHEYAVKENLSDKLILTDSFEEAMTLLSKGRYDAVIIQELVGIQLLNKLGITNVVDVGSFQDTDLKPSGNPLTGFEQKFCIAVRNDDKELLALLNEGLTLVIADGTYGELYNKWFGPILPPSPVPLSQTLKHLFYILGPVLFILVLLGIWYLKREVAVKTLGLQESERKYRDLFDLSPVGIFKTDSNGRAHFVNPEMARILGADSPQMAIANYKDLARDLYVDPNRRKSFIGLLREKGAVENFEYEAKRLNGKSIWLSMNARAREKTSNGVFLIDGFTTDITQRKQAEDALIASEKKLQAVFNRAPVGLILLDSHGLVLDCNRHFATLFGARQEEYIGLNLLDRIPEGLVRQSLVDAISIDGAHHYEGAHISIVSGKQLHVSITYEKITPDLLIAIIMDVSERKRTEEALRESEEKFRLTFSSSPDAVNINRLDDGLYVDINEGFTKLTGYTREEVIGRTSLEINIWHDLADRKKLLQGLEENGVYENLEAQFRIKDGSLVTALMSARVISLKGAAHIISITRDITERKLIEEKLQQAQKSEAIGTLAGGIAHDFNNLLMGIQGRASLMSLDLETAHPHWEHIHAIEDYIRSASSLTKQLLGFARGGKYDVRPIDMNELVRSSSAMFGRTKKEIRIHVKCQQAPLVVEVDRGQIEQVLLNMYVNAWQAMPPGGGELYLETKIVTLDEKICKPYQTEPGCYVKISVTDTGAGMDETTRLKIFDPFFTTKGKSRGTGLGLASAYGIIKNHGGMITVYSEIGHGTTFNIYLPVSRKEAHQETPHEGRLVKGSATILLVDDEEMIIDVGRAMLERLGYRVLISRGGQEAVKTIADRGNEIDLVILDLIMPGMDGGKTFDSIRKIQSGMPVLLSSGYAINGQAQEVIARGCDGFIQKPYSISDLSYKVRNVLDEEKSRRDTNASGNSIIRGSGQ